MIGTGFIASRRAIEGGIPDGSAVLGVFAPSCESVVAGNGCGCMHDVRERNSVRPSASNRQSSIILHQSGNRPLRKYVHGPSIDQPICLIESSGGYAGTHYYHYDGLGSVVAMTNASGAVVQLYEYSVYGQVAASDPNHTNRFMFTGREFDKDTGLYYYRARYYNPEIGRFLQSDPIGYEDGMNMYRYCRNNPLNMTDPLGLESSDSDRPAGELPGFTYRTVEVGTIGQLWGEIQWLGYNRPNRLNLRLIVGNWPAPKNDGNDPWYSVKLGRGYLEGVLVFTVNGVGLLDRFTLNSLIRETIVKINNWPRLPTGDWMERLMCADTPFHTSPITKWLYEWNTGLSQRIFHRSDINYIGIGHAVAHMRIPESVGRVGVAWYKRKIRSRPTRSTYFWYSEGYHGYHWRKDWVSLT